MAVAEKERVKPAWRMRGNDRRASAAKGGGEVQRWKMPLTGGAHLSAAEREVKRAEAGERSWAKWATHAIRKRRGEEKERGGGLSQLGREILLGRSKRDREEIKKIWSMVFGYFCFANLNTQTSKKKSMQRHECDK